MAAHPPGNPPGDPYVEDVPYGPGETPPDPDEDPQLNDIPDDEPSEPTSH